MVHEGKDKVANPDFSEEVELYGDPGIATFDAKVPNFLLLSYLILPIWGIATLCYFWNGSTGWFDRGSWRELQIAANTTFPIENQNVGLEHSFEAGLGPVGNQPTGQEEIKDVPKEYNR